MIDDGDTTDNSSPNYTRSLRAGIASTKKGVSTAVSSDVEATFHVASRKRGPIEFRYDAKVAREREVIRRENGRKARSSDTE